MSPFKKKIDVLGTGGGILIVRTPIPKLIEMGSLKIFARKRGGGGGGVRKNEGVCLEKGEGSHIILRFSGDFS